MVGGPLSEFQSWVDDCCVLLSWLWSEGHSVSPSPGLMTVVCYRVGCGQRATLSPSPGLMTVVCYRVGCGRRATQ